MTTLKRLHGILTNAPAATVQLFFIVTKSVQEIQTFYKGAIHVRAGKCQFAIISYRLRFGCWYFDMLDRMCNQPIEIGFHIQ